MLENPPKAPLCATVRHSSKGINDGLPGHTSRIETRDYEIIAVPSDGQKDLVALSARNRHCEYLGLFTMVRVPTVAPRRAALSHRKPSALLRKPKAPPLEDVVVAFPTAERSVMKNFENDCPSQFGSASSLALRVDIEESRMPSSLALRVGVAEQRTGRHRSGRPVTPHRQIGVGFPPFEIEDPWP
jgi:hypothetical protein